MLWNWHLVNVLCVVVLGPYLRVLLRQRPKSAASRWGRLIHFLSSHMWAATGKASEAILLLPLHHCYAVYVHMRTGERERPWGPEARRREHQPCRFHSCGKPEEKHDDPEIYQLPLLQWGRVISWRTKETLGQVIVTPYNRIGGSSTLVVLYISEL